MLFSIEHKAIQIAAQSYTLVTRPDGSYVTLKRPNGDPHLPFKH